MTVRSITQETEVSRFLYYFFLCLCKSFKELFLLLSLTGFPESGCKGTKFLRNCKQKRKKSCDFNNYFVFYSVYLSKSTDYTLLYICASKKNNPFPDPPPEEEGKEAHTPTPPIAAPHSACREREERRKEERKKKKNA